MQSRARIVADAHDGVTRLAHLEGDGALTVRPTPMTGRTRVHLVAGAFGPLGGDVMTLEIEVGPGAALEVAGVAATVALPSRSGEPSRMQVRIELAEGAGLVLVLPPTVVAAEARHTLDIGLRMAGDAALVLREETVRGRTGECGGQARLVTRLDVADRPVLRQDFELSGEWGGPWRPRAVGSLLVVGGNCSTLSDLRTKLPIGPTGRVRAAWLRLPGGVGYQFTAMEDDPLALSRLLDASLPDSSAPPINGVAVTIEQ